MSNGRQNDAADAAAICEAVTRPSMRFVPIKSADQQALLMLHRTRDLLIRQRTQLINALRAHLAEFSFVAETGREGLAQLAAIITDESNREALPSAMKQALQVSINLLLWNCKLGLRIAPFTPIIVPMT